mgnify:CR=1 FL=1
MDFTIELKKGIGNLMFGMTVENVKQVLGEPTEMETIDNGMEEETLVLHCQKFKLVMERLPSWAIMNILVMFNKIKSIFNNWEFPFCETNR